MTNNPLFSMILCLNKESPPLAVYQNLLKEFSDNWGYHLQIDGAPFEYDHLEAFLRICSLLGIREIGVRTSETIDDNDLLLIKNNNIRSIMFRALDSNLTANLSMAHQHGVAIELSSVLHEKSVAEIDQMILFCKENLISLLVLERGIIAKYRNLSIYPPSPEQYKAIMAKVIRHNAAGNSPGIALSHCPNKILLHQDAAYSRQNGGCSAGIISCAIEANGNIVPCLPLHKVVLGNIKKDSIKDIWNHSEVLMQLRSRDKLLGKCGGCDFKRSCGGCRAESFSRDGDLWGEDPTCWKEDA